MGRVYKTKSDKNIFKRLRQRINLSQTEVAKSLNIVTSTISKWETGKSHPDESTLPRLAELYSVSCDVLLGTKFNILDFNDIQPLPDTVILPLLGAINRKSQILASENIAENIAVDASLKANFALRCKGDSMINARIFDGDIVYIRQQEDVDNGQIAAVLIDTEATLKRVYKYPDKLILRAENPTFPDIVITQDEDKYIRILGKAIAFTSIIR